MKSVSTIAIALAVVLLCAGCSSSSTPDAADSGDNPVTTTSAPASTTAETTTSTTTAPHEASREVVVASTAAVVEEHRDVLVDAFKGPSLVEAVDDFSFDEDANVIRVVIQTKFGVPMDGMEDFQQTLEDNFAWDHFYSSPDGIPFWSDEILDSSESTIPVEYLPSLRLELDSTFMYECGPELLFDFAHKDAGRVQFDEECVETKF